MVIICTSLLEPLVYPKYVDEFSFLYELHV
jgi:hypothetical protein